MKPIKTIVSDFIRGEAFDHTYYWFLTNLKEVIEILNKPSKNGISIKEIFLLLVKHELNNIGVKVTKIDDIIESLKYRYLSDSNNHLEKKDLHFLEYYIWRAFLKNDVNIYVFNNTVEIGTIDEFLMSELLGISKNYINISVNYLLSLIYKREELNMKNTTLLSITNDECEILEQIRLNDKKIDINLSYKDGLHLDEMRIKERLTPDDIKDLAKVAHEKNFGSVEELHFHRGKIVSGKVIKKKRFDRSK